MEQSAAHILEDSRFFRKEKYLFTKTWGIDSKTQTSVDARTEDTSTASQKLDPLANGISINLVNEKPGDVANTIDLGENSLFKLNGIHAPTLLSTTISGDDNYTILTDNEYDKIK